MSESYERERQNNSRLDELASKVSALRGVTIDIYDNARDTSVIDSTVRTFTFSPCPPVALVSPNPPHTTPFFQLFRLHPTSKSFHIIRPNPPRHSLH